MNGALLLAPPPPPLLLLETCAMALPLKKGDVVLVPRTRPGWGAVREPAVPALIVSDLIEQPPPYAAYFEIDSPWLLEHYAELATALGWRWHWPAAELAQLPSRERREGDVPESYSREYQKKPRAARKPRVPVEVPELSSKYPSTIEQQARALVVHPLAAAAAPATLTDVAGAAHAKLRAGLLSQQTSLLLQGYHQQLLSSLAKINLKMHKKLLFKLPVRHKASAEKKVRVLPLSLALPFRRLPAPPRARARTCQERACAGRARGAGARARDAGGRTL